MLNEVIFAHDFRQRKACLQAATRDLKFKIQKNVLFQSVFSCKTFSFVICLFKRTTTGIKEKQYHYQ